MYIDNNGQTCSKTDPEYNARMGEIAEAQHLQRQERASVENTKIISGLEFIPYTMETTK